MQLDQEVKACRGAQKEKKPTSVLGEQGPKNFLFLPLRQVAQAGLQFIDISLPQPRKCRDYKYTPPCLALTVLSPQ